MKNKGNAKAQFSKNLIFQTLMELMEKQPFDKITIQDIANTAMISRQTIYRNFGKKTDILKIGVEQVVARYMENLQMHTDLSFANIAYLLFSTMEDFLPFLRALNKNRLNSLLTDELFQHILLIYPKIKKVLVTQALLFSFGGFESLLKDWLVSEVRETPEEMKEKFYTFIHLMLDERNQTSDI
ncbi:MAG: TetR/AcrR family transcriptional regulator [Tetragenococcus koreensis]|nr:TetR/AcrR family transcriptional regulator [Tetragenococcus koreensis]